jgi:transcriptional regulator with PAS, ATPase and Fis domain
MFEAGLDLRSLIIGESSAIRSLRHYLPKVAARDCSVLITGETGTGKERVAEAIHWCSLRSKHEMVCINCAAVPEALLEGELFGYEKGAFTGALARYPGKLRLADGGTLLLDEIGDMTPTSQAKVLRALETRKVSPLGSSRQVAIDVRMIASTNQELLPLIAQNRFRKDLFYRLNVVHIELSPLRERKEDIPLLVRHYVRHFNCQLNEQVDVAPETMAALMRYDWPGNIRELRNLIEYLFVDPRPPISIDQLPDRFRCDDRARRPEKEQIVAALCATKWNKSQAAKELNWSRMTLYRKLRKYELNAGPAMLDHSTVELHALHSAAPVQTDEGHFAKGSAGTAKTAPARIPNAHSVQAGASADH